MKTSIIAIAAWLCSIAASYAQIASPELDFQLRRYEQRLIAKAAADRRSALELFRDVQNAMRSGRPTAAVGSLEILAGKHEGRGEGGARTWLRLAVAWQLQSASSPRCEAPAEAFAAAYGAYLRSGNDAERIEALSLLGNMLVREIEDRPPSDNCRRYRDAGDAGAGPPVDRETAKRLAHQVFTAAGKLATDGRFKQQAESFAQQAGQLARAPLRLEAVTFPPPPRTGGTRVRCPASTELVQPSSGGDDVLSSGSVSCVEDSRNVCLKFTYKLDVPIKDLAARIRVERSPPTPERIIPNLFVQGEDVCFVGLDYGTTYKFSIDRSLRALDGTAISGPTTAFLKMPHHPATLGFRRGAYVLPAKAAPANARTITLRTMNVRKADLMLRRIGDYNLVREIIVNHIVGGLKRQGACFILNNIGERIADGQVTISAEQNKAAELKLPIGAILDERRQWLMTTLPREGEERTFTRASPTELTALTLKLFGDQAARELARAKEAARGMPGGDQGGVFVVFGKVTDELAPASDEDTDDTAVDPDQPDTRPLKADDCPRGLASQWFAITNIGVTLQRSASRIYVVARELDTGAPVKDATIEFTSKSGARLHVAKTDANGMAEMPARLGRGTGGNALIAVLAYLDREFAFLDMTSDAVDLSDRGFEGPGAPRDYDAFVAPVQGVYRPGQRVQALVMIRDPSGATVDNLPDFEVALVRRDNKALINKVEFKRAAGETTFARDGGFAVDMELPKSTAQGTLLLQVRMFDRVIGEAPVEAYYFQPHTVRVTPENWTGALSKKGELELSGEARVEYLYGGSKRATASPASTAATAPPSEAPAKDLRVELDVSVEPAATPWPHCFEDYTFGWQKELARAHAFRATAAATDSAGRSAVKLSRTDVPGSDVPLQAAIRMSLIDLNGKAGEKRFDVPVRQVGRRWIGLRAQNAAVARSGQPVSFDLIVLDEQNRPVPGPVWVKVLQEQSSFVWSKDGSSWEFVMPPTRERSRIPVKDEYRVLGETSTMPAQGDCPAPRSFSVDLPRMGSYVLVVRDDDDNTTELSFGYGRSNAPDGSPRPDALKVIADRQSYRPGDDVRLVVETPHRSGRVLIEIMVNGIAAASFDRDIVGDASGRSGRLETTIKLPAEIRAGPAYIYATSFRKAEEDSDERGAGRAIGGTDIRVGEGGRRPTLDVRSVADPILTASLGERPSISVQLAAEGLERKAWIALAVVDEGVLSVTDFKTPDPYAHFFGRKRFEFDIFDNYSRILYARTGGDNQAALQAARGIGYEPGDVVAWMSPIVELNDGLVRLEIPTDQIPKTFQGEIRLMVWAWDSKQTVHSERKVRVRDPVVVRVLPPRFMAPLDQGLVALRVGNVDQPGLDALDLRVEASAALFLSGSMAGAAPCGGGRSTALCQRISVAVRQGAAPTTVLIPLQANADDNRGIVKLSYLLPGMANEIVRSWEIPVRRPQPPELREIKLDAIAQGGRRRIDATELRRAAARLGFDPDTVQVTVRLSQSGLGPPPAANPPEADIRQLEQLAAQLQLLIVSDSVSSDRGAATTTDRGVITARLQQLVGEIAVLQNPGGGFDRTSASAKSDQERSSIPACSVIDTSDTSASKVARSSDRCVGEAAFALDVLSRAKAAGATVDGKIIDRAVGYLLSALKRPLQFGDACTRSELYALIVLAKLDRIGGSSFRSVADLCEQKVAADATAKLLLASAYGAFGFSDKAQRLIAEARLRELRQLAETPAESARTAALLTETVGASIDLAALITKIGLKPGDRADSLAISSWIARASSAALDLLSAAGTRPAPITADWISAPGVIARTLRDGAELRPLRLADLEPSRAVEIANRGQAPLQVSLFVSGVRAQSDTAAGGALEVDIKRQGGDAARPNELKQFDVAYFTVEINQKDDYVGIQHLVAIQPLPTGFEGVDRAYRPAWASVLGDAINPAAISESEYTEFQDDRWIALPEIPSGQAHHLLAFSLRPTLRGEFVIPALVVYDLNNPERVAFTKAQRVTVRPAE